MSEFIVKTEEPDDQAAIFTQPAFVATAITANINYETTRPAPLQQAEAEISTVAAQTEAICSAMLSAPPQEAEVDISTAAAQTGSTCSVMLSAPPQEAEAGISSVVAQTEAICSAMLSPPPQEAEVDISTVAAQTEAICSAMLSALPQEAEVDIFTVASQTGSTCSSMLAAPPQEAETNLPATEAQTESTISVVYSAPPQEVELPTAAAQSASTTSIVQITPKISTADETEVEGIQIKTEVDNEEPLATATMPLAVEGNVILKQKMAQTRKRRKKTQTQKGISEPYNENAADAGEDGELMPEPPANEPFSAIAVEQNVPANVENDPFTEEVDALPDNFFEDLLQSADDIRTATGSIAMSLEDAQQERSIDSTGMSEKKTAHIRVKCEAAESFATQEVNTGTEPIPDSFFDDLLVDRLKERLENAENEDLETKYSEKLKELRRLEETNNEEGSKSHKKHKKNKKKEKKAHKRERSQDQNKPSRGKEHSSRASSERKEKRRRRSRSPEEIIHVKREIDEEQTAASLNYGALSKVSAKHDHRPPPPPSNIRHEQATSLTDPILVLSEDNPNEAHRPLMVKNESRSFSQSIYEEQLECLPVHYPTAMTAEDTSSWNTVDTECIAIPSFKRIKLEKISPAPEVSEDEVEEVITPKMKRERAILRVNAILKVCQRVSQEQPDIMQPLKNFLYTATMRKLPASSSYVKQQIYENRSPLHTINNVSYKFSSHATRFNFREWGLEAMPSAAAKIAHIIAYDAQTLHNKLKATTLPRKLRKIKSENTAEDGEMLEETRSSFFTNAMTQTDPVTLLSGAGQRKSHEIGVQAAITCGSIATQTSGTPTEQRASTNEDLPLMQMLDQLNENQLLALNDFAELIREPANSAMDMYRLRQRMLDIYKCSQMPSTLTAPTAVAIPVITNNFMSRDSRAHNFDPRQRVSADPRKQSVAHGVSPPYFIQHPPVAQPQQRRHKKHEPQRPIPESMPPPHQGHYSQNGQRR